MSSKEISVAAPTSQPAGPREVPDSSRVVPAASDSTPVQTVAPPPAVIPSAVSAAKTPAHIHVGKGNANGAASSPPPPAASIVPSAPPPAPSAPPKPNCNPPYVIDALGDHKYKPECL
jgi:hypothetical protein